MALSSQGFVNTNNLKESFSDATVFNNLAGSPEGSDITLLFNNKRNYSSIDVTGLNVAGNTISFTATLAVFSNHTPVSVNNTTYYVKNSNGINSFQLSTSSALTTTVSSPPIGTYIRSDEITQANITNFSVKRRTAVNANTGASNVGGTQNSKNSISSSSDLLAGGNPKDYLNNFESYLDAYKFRTSKSLIKTSNFLSQKTLKTNGVIIIADPDGVNLSTPTNSTPGLFIYNAATNSGIRAFSSNSNPWADFVDGFLKTSAVKITAGKLTISTSTGIVIQSKNSAALISTVDSTRITTLNFTHKLPVSINGETYYLCLS